METHKKKIDSETQDFNSRTYPTPCIKFLLVQARKQYKHQYEQEDLLFLKQGHLPQNQCFQISTNQKCNTVKIKAGWKFHKRQFIPQKHYRTFPIKVLKSRIPGISSPAHIKEMRTARHESWKGSNPNNTKKFDWDPQLTIQITLNFWNTRTCCCRCKMCNDIYRWKD